MRPAIDLGDLVIARPFLAVPRARLAATVAAAGLAVAHDPMNDDPRFARVRIRRALPELAAAGLDPADLAASAFRLAAAADALDAAATALLAQVCAVDRFATATVDLGGLQGAPVSVQRRAAVRLILAVGGGDYPPRAERLDAIVAEMTTKSATSRFRRTLGGVVVDRKGQSVVFAREIGRTGLPDLVLTPGLRAAWDHRYSVVVKKGAPTGYHIGALGEFDRARLKFRAPGHPPSVAAALPALRRRGRLVAVLDAMPDWLTLTPRLGERLLRPPLFPDIT